MRSHPAQAAPGAGATVFSFSRAKPMLRAEENKAEMGSYISDTDGMSHVAVRAGLNKHN